jgi:hypothetical protein
MLRFQCSVLLVALAGSLVGCQSDDHGFCNPSVQKDETFEVTVLGRSTRDVATFPLYVNGQPSCGLDDIHEGDRFQVKLTETFGYGGTAAPCQHFVCPIDFPAPATPYQSAGSHPAMLYVCAGNDAKVQLGPQCELGRTVVLYHSKQATGLYGDADGGGAPPFTLLRSLNHPDSQTVCADVMARFPTGPAQAGPVCADLWQVRLTKR